MAAQFDIDFAERWLIVVKVDERYLQLNEHEFSKIVPGLLEYGQFPALNIDLQKIEPVNFLMSSSRGFNAFRIDNRSVRFENFSKNL